MSKALFDAIRQIKGSPLTQADVDAINRAVSGSEIMRTSKAGIDLIHSFEKLHRVLPDGRIASYPDPGPTGLPWTIGWGSTGPDIGQDTVWTRIQADSRFEADLVKFENGVDLALAGSPVTQNQFDALVSFAYNVGLGNLNSSTLLKKHRSGDYRGSVQEFAKWNKAKGKVLKGLTRRRVAEAALYATPS